MNSLYNPAESLTNTLHFPVTHRDSKVCAYCNLPITFDKNLKRWVSTQWNAHLCKEAK